jgi:hypothetical protein
MIKFVCSTYLFFTIIFFWAYNISAIELLENEYDNLNIIDKIFLVDQYNTQYYINIIWSNIDLYILGLSTGTYICTIELGD